MRTKSITVPISRSTRVSTPVVRRSTRSSSRRASSKGWPSKGMRSTSWISRCVSLICVSPSLDISLGGVTCTSAPAAGKDSAAASGKARDKDRWFMKPPGAMQLTPRYSTAEPAAASVILLCRFLRNGLPAGGLVVLEEAAEGVLAREQPGEHGIADARGAIDDVERGRKIQLLALALGVHGRVLVGDPARVHGVHVDAVLGVVRGRGQRHHVERGLGHVGVRVL